jgi:hypothetical protein
MDFDRVLQQREAKATATSSQETDEMLAAAVKRVIANSKPGPKPKATSKRNDPAWAPATLFLKTETRDQLQRFIHLAKLDKSGQELPGDQSEVVEAALSAWLAKQLPKLEGRVIGR